MVTGTRAEYGLLEPVLRAIEAHPALKLALIVTGTHLISGTARDVAFPIHARVPMQKAGEATRAGDVQALGRGIAGMGKVFAGLRPDAVVVLGDRVEVLAAAAAASVGGHLLVHIHGGDRADGVADEAMRHAVSKLAHVHLPATAQSRRRLIRMGENAGCVFVVGSPAIDGLAEVEAEANGPELIVLQHPIGAADADEQRWMSATLRATRKYSRLVLMPNHDPGRGGIVAAIRSAKVDAVDHLPRQAFLAQLKGARAIVGNSSAGLIEAAALRTACVNVGPRQAGRESPGNVVACDYGEQQVKAAIDEALSLDLRRSRHPYGRGDSGERIAQLLATLCLESIPLRKRNSF